MIKTTIKIDGMMCGMCEAHVSDVIRKNFKVKKVKTSHRNGEAVVFADAPISEEQAIAVFKETGYRVKGVFSEEAKKCFLFFK